MAEDIEPGSRTDISFEKEAEIIPEQHFQFTAEMGFGNHLKS